MSRRPSDELAGVILALLEGGLKGLKILAIIAITFIIAFIILFIYMW